MVASCWVRGCTNRVEKDKKVSFFLIPKVREHEGQCKKTLTEERRRIWLANINRKEEPTKHSRICAAHFIEGRPASMYDRANPVWAPTLKLGEMLTPSKSQKKQSNVETNKKSQQWETVDDNDSFKVEFACQGLGVQVQCVTINSIKDLPCNDTYTVPET